MVRDQATLAKHFETVVSYACLAAFLCFFLGYLSEHAYEHMGWLALGVEDQGPWKEIRDISQLGLARGFRYFLAFLLVGMFYMSLEHLHKPSSVVALGLSILVVPLCLPPVLFFMTSGEFKGQFLAWGMWAMFCALFYWQAKFNASWKIDAVIAIVFVLGLGRIVALDHTVWQSALQVKASQLGVSAPHGTKGYFVLAESVYILQQFITAYLFPRMLIRSLADAERAELAAVASQTTDSHSFKT